MASDEPSNDKPPRSVHDRWIWEERRSFENHARAGELDPSDEYWCQWLAAGSFHHLERAHTLLAESISDKDSSSSYNEASDRLIEDLNNFLRLDAVDVVNDFWSADYVEAFELRQSRVEELSELPSPASYRTPEWQYLREAALRRAGQRCEACNSEAELHVHHRTYENIGNENLSDLLVLCASCHTAIHRAAGDRLFRPPST